MSKIEWTEQTWNPTTGCDRVSPGCDNCYAMGMAKRLKGMGQAKYQRDGDPKTSGPGFGLTEHPDVLTAPLRWKKPRKVFVNSMSDLFHADVTDEFLCAVFDTMTTASRHTFQVLTKRHARMRSFVTKYLSGGFAMDVAAPLAFTRDRPPPNIWLGVSVEDQHWADIRIPALLDTPAAVRFLSCEPLIGPVSIRSILPWQVTGEAHHVRPDWVIVGGESGPGARTMQLKWAQDLVRDCRSASVSVFVKQLGSGYGAHHKSISSFPPDLRVREYPAVA